MQVPVHTPWLTRLAVALPGTRVPVGDDRTDFVVAAGTSGRVFDVRDEGLGPDSRAITTDTIAMAPRSDVVGHGARPQVEAANAAPRAYGSEPGTPRVITLVRAARTEILPFGTWECAE
ncbi:hypothetical protein Mth01_54750 [Sphaerimonospora thailandensis]|uniref:Uncharacterized protein n=1 Tax=Sphaerimonospora thailandensis TaxID=795644 RepID=A0A8J3RCI7_9ACTN|nr:hypothetical protein Mth01_54750 [Sphaerimonospora thailandensis]